MEGSSWSKVASLAKLIIAIAAAGLVVAAMMFPVIGGGGIVARNTASLVDDSPVNFNLTTPSTVSTEYASDGSVLTSYYNQYRQPVAITQIPTTMQQSIVAIEDERFYQHGGIDPKGTVRALFENVSAGGVAQGGSTLTQQLVKNTLLYQATTQAEQKAAVDDSIGRKLNEAKIAIALDKKYSKQEILADYLNLMNFGDGAYGVAAAAQAYWGETVDKLTLEQSALLAGIVQNPTTFNPITHPKDAKVRRDIVLTKMQQQGYITKAQEDAAQKTPITTNAGARPARTCAESPNNGGFFCDYVNTYLTTTLGIPEDTLKNGGIRIDTTFNPDMQNDVDNAIANVGQVVGGKANKGTFGLTDTRIMTMDLVEPGTGKVLALGINRKFGNDPNDPTQTTFNYPTQPGEGAGSTYKIFTAVTGLEMGVGINFVDGGNAPYTSKVFKNGSKPYTVGNAGIYGLNLPLWKALYQSENTYFIALEDHIGSMDPIVNTAQAMGLWAPGDNTIANEVKSQQQASFTLGVGSSNPLRVATAYATAAARGTECEPAPVTDVLGPDGKPLINPKTNKAYYTPGTNCKANAIPSGVADSINQVLMHDMMPGNPGQTGQRAYTGGGRQEAGKSGTAQGNASYAFVAYTPQIVGTVLAYDPTNNKPMPAPGGGEGGFGGGYPAGVWGLAMTPILAKYYPMVPFPPSDPAVDAGNGTALTVNCVGQSGPSCAAALKAAGFSPVQQKGAVASSVPAGAVASQTPAAGATAVPGQVVTYQLSSGPAPAAPATPAAPAQCQPGQVSTPAAPCTP